LPTEIRDRKRLEESSGALVGRLVALAIRAGLDVGVGVLVDVRPPEVAGDSLTGLVLA
jgi:hypothetical protein